MREHGGVTASVLHRAHGLRHSRPGESRKGAVTGTRHPPKFQAFYPQRLEQSSRQRAWWQPDACGMRERVRRREGAWSWSAGSSWQHRPVARGSYAVRKIWARPILWTSPVQTAATPPTALITLYRCLSYFRPGCCKRNPARARAQPATSAHPSGLPRPAGSARRPPARASAWNAGAQLASAAFDPVPATRRHVVVVQLLGAVRLRQGRRGRV
jgi:hypothetical protein